MHNAKLLLLLLFFTQYNLTLKPFFGDSKIKKAALEVLSLDDSASPSEIRKAYYKMALKYHPDKNSSAGAEETFKKCKAAYECLTESNACKLFADMYLNETAKKPSTRQKYKAKKDDFSEGSADPIGEEILGMIDRFFQGLLGIELFNILDNEKNIFLRKSDKKVWEKKWLLC